jgi:hypothetical protein
VNKISSKLLYYTKRYRDRYYPSQTISYQAIVVNIIALWGSESWALKEASRSKLEALHHGMYPQDVRADDVGCSKETDHERTC